MNRAHVSAAAAPLLVLLVTAACSGTWARNLASSARLSLPEVAKHLGEGLDAGLAAEELNSADVTRLQAAWSKVRDALEADERRALIGTPLTELRAWASRGVDERLAGGELGPHTANSIRNQITQFFELVTRLASR